MFRAFVFGFWSLVVCIGSLYWEFVLGVCIGIVCMGSKFCSSFCLITRSIHNVLLIL